MPLTSTHWGTFSIDRQNGRIIKLTPFLDDPDPSEIGRSLPDLLDHPSRIKRPAVRRGWLDFGPRPAKGARGNEPFVEVSWDEAENLVASELDRVRKNFGNNAIYGGSYGWASAGRFHHAQSQLHRFLNCIGGYTSSKNTYSFAAAEVIVPHVIGLDFIELLTKHTSWKSISDNCELFLAFGGLSLENSQMGNGGAGRHVQREGFNAAVDAGVEFINISPRGLDLEPAMTAQQLHIRPNSDTALILALCHTLLKENLADKHFLSVYTVGYENFAAYLDGKTDGIKKDANWASQLTSIHPSEIEGLARRIARKKTLVSVSWSLSRQQYGEQPFWAAISLASMLGQIGTAGGGFGFGYGVSNYVGNNVQKVPYASLPLLGNKVEDFIPVSRISDMLLNPDSEFEYNGMKGKYPDIKIVYWAGGNPFHHHQDLNRLQKAWQRPDTVIIQDWCWNATAKHADIVLPCTTMLERIDIGMTPRDPYVISMVKGAEPVGEARNDYDIFSSIACAMGLKDKFCEGRSTEDWLRYLWSESCVRALDVGVELPKYDELVEKEYIRIDKPSEEPIMLEAFRSDPNKNPLSTPSGKIELFSEKVKGFDYPDCLGHATWTEPDEWIGNATKKYPLHLLGKQPRNKLHSQLDPGEYASRDKISGHEAVEISPDDAAKREIKNGDIVCLSNDRGTCFGGAVITPNLMPGVVIMSTGAWFDPCPETGACRHGNPNILTSDIGTSNLAQGPAAHTCLVEVTRCSDDNPPRSAFKPPIFQHRN
ncbi:MAG: Asp-tRNA(Asn)/Glu-tRNA(Gln) amidotransferase GatCAB subunit C [Rhodospirillaceae bacterium]|nr:Asp-tRNA(Asn)/Glu-tRNA(Gln) amidotransferase GatCAB subunit C [Rhodospirillaceae bacterium]|tara:strand:- start:1384 stop:3678 length:2295 start_codon:yes stop_codon:yes gene_type:complete